MLDSVAFSFCDVVQDEISKPVESSADSGFGLQGVTDVVIVAKRQNY